MNDKAKTKKQLIEELQALRQQVTALPESLQQVDSAQIQLRTWFDNVADPIIIFGRETNRFLDCSGWHIFYDPFHTQRQRLLSRLWKPLVY